MFSVSGANRWVKMAQLIPWSEFESDYAENFPTEMGANDQCWIENF